MITIGLVSHMRHSTHKKYIYGKFELIITMVHLIMMNINKKKKVMITYCNFSKKNTIQEIINYFFHPLFIT